MSAVTDAIIDLLRTALGVEAFPASSVAPAHRPALLAGVPQSDEVSETVVDGLHYLRCRYGPRPTDVLLVGPFLRAEGTAPPLPVLDEDGVERAVQSIERAVVGLREAEAAERQRLELAGQLEVVGRSVLAVTGELELDLVLRRIVDLARELAGARYAALGVPSADKRELTAFLTSGLDDEAQRRIGPLPRGRGLLGLLLREPVTIRLPDLSAHPASVGFPPHHPPMKSFLGVPIISRNRVVGNLYLTEKRAAVEFSETDARLVELLARHAAVAIENANLYRSIEQQQQRLQAVVDQMPEAVILAEVDPERITLANRHAGQVLGWEVGPPMTLADYLARNRRFTSERALMSPEQLPLVRSLRHGDVIARAELAVERSDGSSVTLLVNSAPLRDAQQRITGALAVFQDISQIKDAEQLKDDFLSLVSHELRTPLTTIQGGATLLVRDWERIDAETKLEILGDISTQGYRLGVLVENMVQLANIRAGRRRMEQEPVQVERLIQRAIAAVSRLTDDRSVTLRTELELIAEVDADRIEQVVTNLLHNAVKYSPPGTPVDVTAFRQGHEIVIGVRDYGSGIDAEDLPYIFDRFRRTASAEAGAAPGMGLGLYLSRHVVEVHGGRIWVEQPEGAGTRICFSVPALDAE